MITHSTVDKSSKKFKQTWVYIGAVDSSLYLTKRQEEAESD